MQGTSFYHSLIRKYIITFGDIFNGITVRRFNKKGKVVQNIPVPIKYGHIAQYLQDITQPAEGEKVNLVLPMMSFFDVNLMHDTDRQMNPIHTLRNIKVKGNKSQDFTFMPVPYKMTMELSIITKTIEDASQIVEQILPFFTPSINQSVEIIEGFDPYDILVSISGVTKEHAFDQARQFIIYTLTFDMSIWLLGSIGNQGLIKKSIVSIISENKAKSVITTTAGLTPDGKPTSNKDESIDYMLIKPDDDYGYIQEIEDFIIYEED